jgi:hypothetical protein
MRITKDSISDYRVEYDSTDDLVKHVNKRDSKYKHLSSRKSDTHYTGGADWPQGLRLARDGWSEGLERVANLRDELAEVVGAMLPEPRPFMDVAGFDVDVGAYCSGEPEHMVTWVDQDGGKRQVHIVLNLATAWNVTSEATILRGSVVAALIDAMESLGHRVRLDASWSIRGTNGGILTITTSIKTESQALDLERLVFAAAHPAMQRRLMFAAAESLPQHLAHEYQADGSGHYGWPAEVPHDLRGDVYIESRFPRTVSEALDETVAHLRRYGLIDEEA